ncbi:diguanylate cyclase domain-containing protein [Vibrio genomosp. F10]|uniref:diguanylate cyclase domain-containing protein n=2 Tax=Vibrio genomosp. F10 TaxID=723171 RepID=UPI0002ED50E2|nr:diguanylate cyclase [Vibrio genomosp. F10]OEF10628.1 diguanylate cyclase [Vibrio genomosp. F10 str. 9ZB36]
MVRYLSLRNKLTIPIILFVFITYIVAQGYGFIATYTMQKNALLERIDVVASSIALNLQTTLLLDDPAVVGETLSVFSADENVLKVKLYSINDDLLGMYQQQGASTPTPNVEQQKEILSSGFSSSGDFIYVLTPVKLNGETIARLRVTISKATFKQLYNRVLLNGYFSLLLLVVAGFGLYRLIEKFILTPVFALNQAISTYINHDGKNERIEVSSNDEIGDLVSAFNTMLDRISMRERQVVYTLDKLEQEKSFVNEVVETVQHGLIVVDDKGNILHFNAACNDVFKCTPAYLTGANLLDVINVDKQSQLYKKILSGNEFDDVLLIRKDIFNHEQRLEITCRKLSKEGQFLFAIQDVTNIQSVLSRQRLAAGVVENSQDGLMVINQDGYITMVNPAVTQLLGYTQDQLVERRPEDVMDWHQAASLMPIITESVVNFGQWQGEISEKHRNGNLVPMFVKVNRIVSSDKDSIYDWVFMLSDLSNIKELERLEYLAHHDSLTGLANRAHLYRVLDEVITNVRDNQQGFALLYLDLDGFKQVNDTYGHDAGDEVLRQVSQRLLSQVRSQDLVARLSGDEFVVVINPCLESRIGQFSQRLIHLLSEDIVYNGQVMTIGASVGACHINDSTQSLDTILKVADRAMYQAKSSGKGKYILIGNTD